MSPRRARRPAPRDKGRGLDAPRPLDGVLRGMERVEEGPDGEWKVRSVSGAGSDKIYRCPGCDQEIRPGLPHVVSWPNWSGGEGERRHWHTACWRKRIDRGPGRSRY
ncbi:ATP/GTP-binding protein [Sphaerisporangium perillae]|uniref:ATP/GTP-binding protein n=1 Tax=Sphaerisporangium perillae TaxID=2935860 RepID=UPI00200D5AF8|nr:ATP/GTP-binding protein [Sphaerisporangium perillae]